MTVATAELVLQAATAALASVTTFAGRVYEHNPANPPQMSQTPVAVLRFGSVEPQAGLREREFAFEVDVYGESHWYTPLGIGPQRAILQLARQVELAMMNARAGVLDKLRFEGASRITEEDGQTRNGVTLRWAVIYTETGVL